MTAPDAGRLERARRFAARAAVIGCALVLAVIVASAYLRISHAGPGWSGITGLARIVHRFAASAEALLAVMIVAVCWKARREWPGGALTTAAIAALTVFLTALGIATAEGQSPPVTLGNLLGGMALLGTLWLLRLQAQSAAVGVPSAAVVWIGAGVLLLALQIALGGLVSAHGAAKACTTLPGCEGEWWPADASRALHMAHRFGAVLVLLYWAALALGLRLRESAGAAGAAAVSGMLLAQAALGAIVVASGAAVAAAVVHNAWAALTVVVAVRAAFYAALPGEAEASAARQIDTSK
jgi:cytochrome c oxidase assembly protein subunit 15